VHDDGADGVDGSEGEGVEGMNPATHYDCIYAAGLRAYTGADVRALKNAARFWSSRITRQQTADGVERVFGYLDALADLIAQEAVKAP
jgi:hypothetical protein